MLLRETLTFLSATLRLPKQAFERISEAQQANEFDMDGHASKAKDLLQQANEQLRTAANYANSNHK